MSPSTALWGPPNPSALAGRERGTAGNVKRLGLVAFHIVPVVVIFALWLPVVDYYHVPGVNVTQTMVEQARDFPSDSVLEELKDFRLLEVNWKDQQATVEAASGLLRGDLQIPGCPPTHITVPFSPQDLVQGTPACQLKLAGLVVPDTLLKAYEATGREEFFAAAEAVLVNWQTYEHGALLPKGALWDDHPLAARVAVLADFWRLYRHSQDYRPEVARSVLQMIGHSEQLLAKPAHFTFASNHGIMQNLALWHATLAFPTLPHTAEYQRLAYARMNDQMKFYVTSEGAVLEHSAGYQFYGLKLLGLAFRYLDLLHQTAPEEWAAKYDSAKQVYALLRRPDGTLPMSGDTDSDAERIDFPVVTFGHGGQRRPVADLPQWKPPSADTVLPVPALSVWWEGLEFWPSSENLSQTVVTWANFAGHAHKHADEMSLLFWAGGQNWWTNVGYWPYGIEGRDEAVSWSGSNAPHLVGERFDSSRDTRLVSSGWSQKLAMLELERTGPGNYIAHRQVIHWRPNLWVVLDTTTGGEGSRTSTTWTTAPDVRWQAGQTAGSFLLEGSTNRKDQMDVFFLASPGAVQKLFRGSFHPFAGWQVEAGVPVPASALVVEQPATSWAATVWTWKTDAGTSRLVGPPEMSQMTSATDWQIQLHTEAGSLVLSRHGNLLRAHHDGAAEEVSRLSMPPDISLRLEELRSHFDSTASQYRPLYVNSAKRLKVIWLLVVLYLLQLVSLVVYNRVQGPRINTLRWLALTAWIAGGMWLIGFYF